MQTDCSAERRWSRRDFLGRSGAVAAALSMPGVLAACGTSNGGGTTADATLRFMLGENFWANWNSYGHQSLTGFKVQHSIFDRLVEIQADGRAIEPGLAERFKRIDDRTWEFKLREGVKFHGGASLTGQDVKASIELASGTTREGREFPMAGMWGVPHEVEVIDARTVRISGRKPLGSFLNMLALTDIRSKADIDEGIATLEKSPNGTGAFRITRDDASRKLAERFDGHYRGPAQLPKVMFEYVGDKQTRFNAFLAGQSQIIDRVEPDQISVIDGREDVAATSKVSGEVQGLFFRHDKPPFADNAALRRALAWGIDREAVRDLIGGETMVATSHLAGPLPFHVPQSPAYGFDPERARAELRAAGISEPPAFDFFGSTGFYPKSREVCELIAANLKEAGFNVKLSVLEYGAWVDVVLGEEKRGSMFHGGWANMTGDQDFTVSTLFHSPGAWTGYSDSRADELIDTGRTLVDEAPRAAAYADLQQFMWQEMPSIPLVYSEISNGVAGGIDNFEIFTTFVNDFWPVTWARS